MAPHCVDGETEARDMPKGVRLVLLLRPLAWDLGAERGRDKCGDA